MRRVWVDFNAELEGGYVPLNTIGSRESIGNRPLEIGERVVLHDDEVEVDAFITVMELLGRVGRVDWATLRDIPPAGSTS